MWYSGKVYKGVVPNELRLFDEEGKGKEQEMLTTITNINNAINGVVWGWPALILLGVTGVLMTCLTKF